MIEIRPAQAKDLPEILSVLKAGLGEGLIKKNQEIWNYKHIENPFGKSLVWVGIADKKIVGVRAFMQWKWQKGNHVYQTYRAVDTATHPDYQGRGIFKQLTLKAVEEAAKTHQFVFNTPNEKSRPGYLKMGWKIAGKINVKIIPVQAYIFSKSKSTPNINDYENLKNLCDNYNKNLSQSGKIFTPKTPEYLKWRYEQNPIIKYNVFQGKNYYTAVYKKKHKYFNELRISENIYNTNDKETKNIIKANILKFAKENKCQIITQTGKQLFSMGLKGNFGPILTVKNLSLNQNQFEQIKQIQNWEYGLGDLELF